MGESAAKPGARDGSTPLVMTLAGVVVGLVLFVTFGVETSRFGVISFVVGGALVGGLVAASLARHGRSVRPRK